MGKNIFLNIQVAIVFLTMCLFISCKKDVANETNSITLNVNGVLWKPSICSVYKNSNLVVIHAKDNNKQIELQLSINKAGAYYFDSINNRISYTETSANYSSTHPNNGQIVISECTGSRVKGEFTITLGSMLKSNTNEYELKGSFDISRFDNNPYGFDNGKIVLYKPVDSCNNNVRISLAYNSGTLKGQAVSDPDLVLHSPSNQTPVADNGVYINNYNTLNVLLNDGEYIMKYILQDENQQWTDTLAGDQVIKVKKGTGSVIKVNSCKAMADIAIGSKRLYYPVYYNKVPTGKPVFEIYQQSMDSNFYLFYEPLGDNGSLKSNLTIQFSLAYILGYSHVISISQQNKNEYFPGAGSFTEFPSVYYTDASNTFIQDNKILFNKYLYYYLNDLKDSILLKGYIMIPGNFKHY